MDGRKELEAASFSNSGSQAYSNSPLYTSPEAEGFDFHRLMAVMLRRWPAMLGVFLSAMLIGLATAFFSKPIYEAQATVELTAIQRNGAMADIPGLEVFQNAGQSGSIDTQIETLRGAPLHNRAMQTLKADTQQPLRSFAPVTVTQVGTTNLISVAVQSYNPDAATKLSNAICKQYIVASLEKNRSNSSGAVKYVQNQLDLVHKRSVEAQTKLKKFKQENRIFSISDEASALGSKLAGLQQAVAAADSERAATQAKLKGLQTLLSRLPANRVVPSGIQRNPVVAGLQAQLTQLELERSTALREYTPKSYKVVSIDSQIKALKDQLASEAKTMVSGWQPDPSRAPLASDAASTQTQMWSMDARNVALKQQVQQAREAMDQLPEQEFRYTQLATDTQVLQDAYQTLSQRLQSLKIGEQAKVADARLVFAADVPTAPIAPNKKKLILYATVLGLLGAVAMALVLDMLDNRIYSDEEAQRITGLPVLSHVPFARHQEEISLMPAPGKQASKTSPLLESFRMLRANIAFSAVDKPIRALVVTSSVPHEGKSNSAFNLAAAAAIDGERVILVDLDLRRPTAHSICGLPNKLGFSSVATNRCTLEEALQDTSIPGLRVLTAGPVPPNSFKLLNTQNARTIVNQLAEQADFVVIDTPPMLGMADARLIASWVDGTLLVVSCRDVARREVARAADLLMQGGTEVFGLVLTKITTGNNGSYGYNYYGYRQYGEYLDIAETPNELEEKTLKS
ncbi:GumC family protein [Abditibacterium utsteinense]|uniref:GumC family protein n=1 Tax=Abditibacterium utsteinense TaxID=1960156 RepID=UPI0014751BE3|nr:polysaccharide biosynthesis tyrosine autokinase [Abditibacterium utsteinense]